MTRIAILLLIFVATALSTANAADDPRQLVEMPTPMVSHMLGNMRDHLLAITEIQQAIGRGEFQAAAEIAETRLGMSSLKAHGASHMAAYMPQAMQDIGTAMHRAASRFALIAQEAGADGNVMRAVEALAEVTQQCVACHAAYRAQ